MVKVVVVLNSSAGGSGKICPRRRCASGPTTIIGILAELAHGLHGFHVHALGDTTNDFMPTGPHCNPAAKENGAPDDEIRHVGELRI